MGCKSIPSKAAALLLPPLPPLSKPRRISLVVWGEEGGGKFFGWKLADFTRVHVPIGGWGERERFTRFTFLRAASRIRSHGYFRRRRGPGRFNEWNLNFLGTRGGVRVQRHDGASNTNFSLGIYLGDDRFISRIIFLEEISKKEGEEIGEDRSKRVLEKPSVKYKVQEVYNMCRFWEYFDY